MGPVMRIAESVQEIPLGQHRFRLLEVEAGADLAEVVGAIPQLGVESSPVGHL